MTQAWAAWFLAFAIFASIKNVSYALKHENYEGVIKWTISALLFIFALLVSVFA